MTKLTTVARTLSTIQVGDDPVVLDCSPDFAESVWYEHVHYRDHKHFELVTEWFGSSQCKVFIRRWDDSPDPLVNGDGRWWFVSLILIVLGVLWLIK